MAEEMEYVEIKFADYWQTGFRNLSNLRNKVRLILLALKFIY